MLHSISLSKKPKKLKLSLHKPNREKIRNIVDFSDESFNFSLSDLSTLSFQVPYFVEREHELVKSKVVEELRERFLIKLQWNNVSQWYMITELSDSSGSEGDSKQVSAKSLEYELSDKLIGSLSVTSYSPSQILEDALSDTIWSVGTIYNEITSKYRSFDVSDISVLDFVSQIADTFGVMVTFDTENRRVNLGHPDQLGINRGLRFSYGKYLKSVNKTSSAEEMVTRLKVFGKDGVSIQTVNPTGSNYIESFNYFLFPFERDENKNTIKKSDYMSEDLCHAILDYEELVESKSGEFQTYLTNLKTYNEQLATKEAELATLNTELKVIQDELDIAKANDDPTAEINTRLSAKQVEVNTKQSEIDTVESNISTVATNIAALKSTLSIENNFSPTLIQERNQYIIERNWTDSSYEVIQELYDDAKLKFEEIRKPKVTIDIDIVNFLELLEEQRNWDKLYLSDSVIIYHEILGINIRALISDISYSNGEISLTIKDIREIKKKDPELEMFKKTYSTSTSVEMNKYKWNKTVTDLGEVNDIINNTWDATKRRIIAGADESVQINERGILITNPKYPNDILIIQAGCLALSKNGGQDWQTAILPDGIVAERLMGKIIAGVNLIIENESGKFTFDSEGATIQGSSFNLIGGQNGVSIDSETGMTVKKSDNTVKVSMNATEGIKISTSSDNGVTWEDNLSINSNGQIVTKKITIKRPDGFDVINDGYANLNFSVFPHDPPFIATDGSVAIDGVYYRTNATSPKNMNFYTYRHEGRYLKMQVAYYVSSNSYNYAGNFYVMESEFETYLMTKTFTNQGSSSATHGEILTIDLGTPTGTQKAFYVRLRAATSEINAYARIIRIWQEG